jgi:hypothetical protein
VNRAFAPHGKIRFAPQFFVGFKALHSRHTPFPAWPGALLEKFWPAGDKFINLRKFYHAYWPFSQVEKFL